MATLAAVIASSWTVVPSRAEVAEVTVSKGYGILYLPLIVMEDQKLLEKQAEKAGLGNVAVKWRVLDGGNVINDAMMAGSLDFAGSGAPAFVALWSKAKGIPNTAVIGVSALSATSLYLNSNNPQIKSLSDFKSGDKIALPGIKTSLSAVVLQMMAAKQFGIENYARLDPLTVGLPHPEGLIALTSGRSDVTAHFTSPPFSYLELKDPKVHRIASSVDDIGNITLDVVYASKKFVDANPKMTEAMLAALDEADAFIRDHREEAAEIFIRSSKTKISKEDVLTILGDPDTQFSTTPNSVKSFADFMQRVGVIKVGAEKWSDMFIPQLGSRNGS
ncbi:MAG: ABC transporter substrate-binding protein [Xanthobacteraceae bacterium]|nr:ABC transporter substrate-binding protein [Xanthobacteraceae bacterium]